MALNALLLFLILGIFAGSALPILPSWMALSGLLFACLLILLLYIRSRDLLYPWRTCLRCLLGFGVGMSWAIFYGHTLLAQRLPDQFASDDFIVEGVVINLPEHTERGERFDLQIEHIVQVPASYKQESFVQVNRLNKLRLNFYNNVDNNRQSEYLFQPGQRWHLCVRLKPPRGLVNPYGFDYEGWLLQEGYSATGYVRLSPDNTLLADQNIRFGFLKVKTIFDRWGFRSLQWIDDHVVNLDQRALFAAIALGYKQEFTRRHWDILKDTGTIHLVVVSGLNIVLAAAAGYFLLSWLARLVFFPLLVLPAPVWGAVGAITLAVFYAGMTGLSLPTQRSLIMVLCGLMTLLLRRQLTVQSGFLIALAMVLIFDPLAGFTASLWLSFGAVAVLLYCFAARVFVKEKVTDWKSQTKILFSQWLRTQWFVSLGLFPLLAYWMGSVPLITPIANLFAVPFATFVLLPLTIFSGLTSVVSPVTGDIILKVCGCAIDLFWWFLQRMQQINNHWHMNWHMTMGELTSGEVPSFIVLIFALLAILVLLAPRGAVPRFYGLFMMLPLLLPWQHQLPDGEFEITVVDVGQGLSILIKTKNTMTVYDVGDRYSDQFDIGRDVVAQLVHRYGYSQADTLIISHSDSDHAGGLQGLLSELTATRLLSGTAGIIQERLKNSADMSNTIYVESCFRGQTWQHDDVLFEVLSPEKDAVSSKRNNQSCVVRVSNTHYSVLLTGDIERDREQQLLYQAESLKSTVLVVPHHGSKSSSSREFLNAVNPELALVSVGYKSQYGHPHPMIVQRYQESDIPFWRTDQSGALRIRSQDVKELRAARRDELGYWHRW